MRHKRDNTIGGSMQLMRKGTNGPAFDTYDSAEHLKGTQALIVDVMKIYDSLTEWEKNFICDVYGQEPLSRRQHITIYKIHKKYLDK